MILYLSNLLFSNITLHKVKIDLIFILKLFKHVQFDKKILISQYISGHLWIKNKLKYWIDCTKFVKQTALYM